MRAGGALVARFRECWGATARAPAGLGATALLPVCVCVHEGVGVACGLVGGGAPKSIAVSVPPAVYTSNPSRLATKLAL